MFHELLKGKLTSVTLTKINRKDKTYHLPQGENIINNTSCHY